MRAALRWAALTPAVADLLRVERAGAAAGAAVLPTAYCLLPTAYCPLPTAYCLLPTAYCLLPTAYCLLPTAY